VPREQTGQHTAHDDAGVAHTILEFWDYKDVPQRGGGTKRHLLKRSYATPEGQKVNRINEKTFEIIHAGPGQERLRVIVE